MIYCIGKTVKEKHWQINQIFTQKILPEGENRKIIDYRLYILRSSTATKYELTIDYWVEIASRYRVQLG